MSYLELDFKSREAITPRRRERRARTPLSFTRLLRGLTALATLVGGVYLSLSLLPDSEAKVEDSNLKQQRLHYSVLLPSRQIDPSTAVVEDLIPTEPSAPSSSNPWNTVQIKTGDTLASIFSGLGLSATTTYEVDNLNKQTKQLRKIRPGQNISVLMDDDKQLVSLKYMPDITQTLEVKRQEDGSLSSQLIHHPLEAIPVFRSGTINSSLFEAAADSGISENIIMELASIFGWDIDFALDIREGDQFSIVYNELYKDGDKIRDGRILAAEFINQGDTYRAVYYTDPKGDSGYFSPDGKSMRKAFLRSPVKFSRISSRFSNRRWHPILSKWRSHKGVDYAAPTGTPIRAAGDGKVNFTGTKGGYGKTVILQHGGKYTTLYAHMSRYARGMKKGKKIKQGQVIGYVGKTGLASGPHLHYEFRLNGVHRNPLTIKLPAAEPVNKAYKAHFEQETKSYLSMLELMQNQVVAQLNQ
ncbi:MAG: peptidoglycan DD-metalloendopeptidase family protein [Gammaproteobacteria bacterium]|nr:peptidoglycan DD-metalloendopeptidase family protein [Gammaproteobacteria bacterium]